MFIEALLAMSVYVLSKVAVIINALFEPISSIVLIPYNGVVGASYIFGNLGLFNQILPIQELIFLAGLALVLKGTVFGFKVFWAVMYLTSNVMRKIITFRS